MRNERNFIPRHVVANIRPLFFFRSGLDHTPFFASPYHASGSPWNCRLNIEHRLSQDAGSLVIRGRNRRTRGELSISSTMGDRYDPSLLSCSRLLESVDGHVRSAGNDPGTFYALISERGHWTSSASSFLFRTSRPPRLFHSIPNFAKSRTRVMQTFAHPTA